jgi:hypothetical protein
VRSQEGEEGTTRFCDLGWGDHNRLVQALLAAPDRSISFSRRLEGHDRAKGQRLAGIPETSDADVRAQRRQLVVPAGIRVRLVDRLAALVSKATSGPAAQRKFYHIFMRGGDCRS